MVRRESQIAHASEARGPGLKPAWVFGVGILVSLLIVSPVIALGGAAIPSEARVGVDVVFTYDLPGIVHASDFGSASTTPKDALVTLPPSVVATVQSWWDDPNGGGVSPEAARSANENITRYRISNNVPIWNLAYDRFAVQLAVIDPNAAIVTDYAHQDSMLGLLVVHNLARTSIPIVEQLPNVVRVVELVSNGGLRVVTPVSMSG